MKFAIISLQGKQFLVKEGDRIVVDGLDKPVGEVLKISPVLLLADDTGVKVGTPDVTGAVVEGLVTGNGKGEKIRVAKFKAKSRYRKVIGFRAQQATVEIKTIGAKSEKASAPAAKTSVSKKAR